MGRGLRRALALTLFKPYFCQNKTFLIIIFNLFVFIYIYFQIILSKYILSVVILFLCASWDVFIVWVSISLIEVCVCIVPSQSVWGQWA